MLDIVEIHQQDHWLFNVDTILRTKQFLQYLSIQLIITSTNQPFYLTMIMWMIHRFFTTRSQDSCGSFPLARQRLRLGSGNDCILRSGLLSPVVLEDVALMLQCCCIMDTTYVRRNDCNIVLLFVAFRTNICQRCSFNLRKKKQHWYKQQFAPLEFL